MLLLSGSSWPARAIASNPWSGVPPVPLALPSLALGVGYIAPTCSLSGLAFRAIVSSLAAQERQSRAVGVAQSPFASSVNVVPECRPLSVE